MKNKLNFVRRRRNAVGVFCNDSIEFGIFQKQTKRNLLGVTDFPSKFLPSTYLPVGVFTSRRVFPSVSLPGTHLIALLIIQDISALLSKQ